MEIIDTGLEFGSNFSIRTSTHYIVLHHSGVSVLQSVETIHNYHKSKGWCGIGYHYYVRKNGKVYRGRPESYAGAHCVGNGRNRDSIGICCEGNFDEETMCEAQLKSLIELINDIKSRYDIWEIGRHKDYDSTSCPGANFPLEKVLEGKWLDESISQEEADEQNQQAIAQEEVPVQEQEVEETVDDLPDESIINEDLSEENTEQNSEENTEQNSEENTEQNSEENSEEITEEVVDEETEGKIEEAVLQIKEEVKSDKALTVYSGDFITKLLKIAYKILRKIFLR